MNRLVLIGLSVTLLLLTLVACSRPAAEPPAATTPSAAEQGDEASHAGEGERAVKLSAEAAASLGLTFIQAKAAQYAPEVEGFAVVVSHDAIAQVVADLATAESASRQSHAVLARMDRLAGTAGADTAESREAAERQLSNDQTASVLAQRKLSVLLGQQPPWTGDGAVLQQVASGAVKVARVTFPIGAIKDGTPHSIRLARPETTAAAGQWHTRVIWNAPADATMPGRSYFALLSDASIGEGERLYAWAPDAESAMESGVWVPAIAAVAQGGRYWCYVQRGQGTFERIPLDISRPLRDGYFTRDLKLGDSVVSHGAGLLLARELHPEADSD